MIYLLEIKIDLLRYVDITLATSHIANQNCKRRYNMTHMMQDAEATRYSIAQPHAISKYNTKQPPTRRIWSNKQVLARNTHQTHIHPPDLETSSETINLQFLERKREKKYIKKRELLKRTAANCNIHMSFV